MPIEVEVREKELYFKVFGEGSEITSIKIHKDYPQTLETVYKAFDEISDLAEEVRKIVD